MTDLEIAQNATLLPVKEIAKKLNINEDDIDPYGKYKAKLPLHLIDAQKIKNSKLVLVTAITPTPAGEGKTTVSIGLTEGLNKIGKKAIAVLREQGVNGQVEMAAAFHRAGFEAYDVHMSDLLNGRFDLADFQMLAACGGFSYGDVLGAGEGWAKTILFNAKLRDMFAAFFARPDTLSLGVCNGCQMMSNLAEIIPHANHWAKFKRNESEQFEARFSMVRVPKSPSIILADMVGSALPVVVSHGEGRADFAHLGAGNSVPPDLAIALQYIDGLGEVTQTYPLNPNGSPNGIAGITTADGRVTIMMPHPERTFLTAQMSWQPESWKQHELAGWYRLFAGARKALG